MAESEPKVALLKFYVKDLSFETSNSAQLFVEKRGQEWNPDIDLQFGNKVTVLKDNLHEIVLELTVTAKTEGKMVFLVEVQMAGLFDFQVSDETQMTNLMSGPCLQMLFPYIREVVSDLVTRGGYPQLLIAPVNFASLYHQHLEEVQSAQKKESNH